MTECFSTEAVDLDNQAPNRNKRESRYFWDELNHLLAAGGFHNIEVPYEPKWDFGGRSAIPRSARSAAVKFGSTAAYMSYLKENGIDNISCIHLNPSLFAQGPVQMYFKAAQHYGEEAVAYAKESGCSIVTLSVTPPYAKVKGMAGNHSEEEFLNQTEQMVKALAAKAKECGVTLCLKNEYWTLLRGEKISAFLDRFDGNVKLDLDTANLAIAGTDVLSVISSEKDRIGVVHITDTSFRDEDETWKSAMPEFPKKATKVFTDIGEGSLNLDAVIAALRQAGYDGTVVFNPKDSYDISRSILRTRYFIQSRNVCPGTSRI